MNMTDITVPAQQRRTARGQPRLLVVIDPQRIARRILEDSFRPLHSEDLLPKPSSVV